MEKIPFDPVLGARIFGEIQAEGLRAAGALVERLVHLVDGPVREAPTVDAEAEPVRTDAITPWFDLWRDLLERSSETVQRLQGGEAGLRLLPAEPLTITIETSGRGKGELWLHNGTATDHGELALVCGPLCNVDGDELAGEVTFDPPRIVGMPNRSSRGFTLLADVDSATAPGSYRGIVQVRGADAVWMPIELVVPT